MRVVRQLWTKHGGDMVGLGLLCDVVLLILLCVLIGMLLSFAR